MAYALEILHKAYEDETQIALSHKFKPLNPLNPTAIELAFQRSVELAEKRIPQLIKAIKILEKPE